MGKVTFDENYIKRPSKTSTRLSRMTSFLIKTGLVKNEQQAKYLKLVVIIVLFSYIFWAASSLMPNRFDGDLTKLPEDVSSYILQTD